MSKYILKTETTYTFEASDDQEALKLHESGSEIIDDGMESESPIKLYNVDNPDHNLIDNNEINKFLKNQLEQFRTDNKDEISKVNYDEGETYDDIITNWVQNNTYIHNNSDVIKYLEMMDTKFSEMIEERMYEQNYHNFIWLCNDAIQDVLWNHIHDVMESDYS